MLVDGRGTKWRRNIAEKFNWMTRTHERYRQTDRQTAYSKRELTFTFAKKTVSGFAINPIQRTLS